MPRSQYSYHADRYSSGLFASLWVDAWGERYPVQAAPFSSCTHRLLGELESLLEGQPGDVLIDLGCGTGGVGLSLSRKLELDLVGVDRCSDAIAIATRRASQWGLANSTSFVVGDFCATGLTPASAGAVLSVDAFTATEDIECALSEVRRILKPDGIFVFTARQLGADSRHFKKMGPDWKTGLAQNGFENISIMIRPEVSKLWQSLYREWLKREADLRRELQPETVDALIAEARRGMPKMRDGRPWYLIKASVA